MRAVRAAVRVGAVALALCPGCGGPEPHPPRVPTAALPVAGAWSDAPAAPRMDVEVTADGGVYVEGKLLEGADFVDEAARRATAAGRDALGISSCAALLRVDAHARWDVVSWVMGAFADPRVKLPDLFFAVRTEDERAEASLFLPLPVAVCCGAEKTPGRARVSLRADDRPPDRRAAFHTVWTAVQAAGEGSVATIFAPPDLAAGAVLETADLCLRAGASQVQFQGVAKDTKDPRVPKPTAAATSLQAHVALAGPARTGWRIRAGDLVAAADTDVTGLPSPPRAVRRAVPRRRGKGMLADDLPEEEVVLAEDVIAKEPTSPEALDRPDRGGRAQDAVDRALAWLAAHQSADGSWSADRFGEWCDGKRTDGASTDGAGSADEKVGVSALALVAFEGAGWTTRSEAPWGPVVARGIRALATWQNEDGSFGERVSQSPIGDAGATLALAQDFAATGDEETGRRAERGLGGLSRRLREAPAVEDEESVVHTAWTAFALLAAKAENERRHGTSGVNLDAAALDGVPPKFHASTDARTGRITGSDRLAGVAASAWTRIQLGETFRTSGDLVLGADLLRGAPPQWSAEEGRIDFTQWWFGTLAAFAIGGETWKAWEAGMTKAILATQRTDGEPCGLRGSWNPADSRSRTGGRVHATALLCLCCEVYLRYDAVFIGHSIHVTDR